MHGISQGHTSSPGTTTVQPLSLRYGVEHVQLGSSDELAEEMSS